MPVSDVDNSTPSSTPTCKHFPIPPAEEPLGPNFRVFRHAGAGGSYGQADPESRMSFGYAMNLMHSGAWLVDPRPRALLRAVYAALGQVKSSS